MDYGAALAWLDAHVNLEALRQPGRSTTPTLERMRELMDVMAEPQRQYPAIHLTGTNGKTSTARMATRLLDVAGLTVGTYTSPHLHRINERMTWNLEPISDGAFGEVVGAVADLVPLLSVPPSYFELLTAAAFRWFADVAVHAAVVEVGLLGRWDATNVVDGQVAVVTNVGPDHLDYAGTVENVAAEKAGIVKQGSTLVLGETDPMLSAPFLSAAAAAGAAAVWRRDEEFACTANELAHKGRLLSLRTPGARYHDVFLSLHGAYQGDNAAIAVAAVEAFLGEPLGGDVVEEALAMVTTPGRLEVVGHRPLVVVDGAHNPPGATALADTLVEEFGDDAPWTVVLGLLTPHDPADVLAALDTVGIRAVVACAPVGTPRAVAVDDVVAAAEDAGYATSAERSVAAACRAAVDDAGADGRVLVTGSLYTVAEARSTLVASAPRQ
jgi:dihydrofolate synthase/folylpolyglutamate synthase